MRLGKKIKLNIILAILLCMAFALDVGITLAASAYTFLADSSGSAYTTTQVEDQTYTEYAKVISESGGQIPYNIGSMSHNMDLSYGFSDEYDLKLDMTISYNNTSHKLNDFTLNFVDRNKWSIDTPTSFANITSNDASQTHYSLTSDSNTMTISMYYIGSLTGSGTLPIISGVTFYNDYLEKSAGNYTTTNYTSDYLTITITPTYVKVLTSGSYTSTHSFKSSNSGVGFTNWIAYKNNTKYADIDDTPYIVYNNHGTQNTGILFPQDFACPTNIEDLEDVSVVENSTTAYRYLVTSGSDPVYNGFLAGNMYSGGVGVFVYPGAESSIAVSINVIAYWAKWDNGGVTLNAMNNPIHLGYSTNDLTFTNNKYYYKKTISEPTYINVLEYIMLTAQGSYDEIWRDGYKLIISSVDVQFDTTSLSGSNSAYSINNSTTYSPILARYKDSGTNADINVSITNQSENPIKINSFSIKGKMWYPNNSSAEQYNEEVSYIQTSTPFTFDENLWEVELVNSVYTFTALSTVYIPYGYEMPLIKGVTVPAYTYTDTGEAVTVYDRWCAIEISNINIVEVNTSAEAGVYVSNSTYLNIETSAPNYYVPLNSNGEGYITIKNNTNQVIESAKLTLSLMGLANGKNLRKEADPSANFNYQLISAYDFNATATTYTSTANTVVTLSNLHVLPGERVVICKFTPSQRCLIESYSVTVALKASKADTDVMVDRKIEHKDNYNQAFVINNTANAYQFRISSPNQTLTTAMLGNDFVIDSTGHYAYYVGVIYPNQIINLGSGLINNQTYEIQKVAHALTGTITYGSGWSNIPSDWTTKMQNIYETPSDILDKIKNA